MRGIIRSLIQIAILSIWAATAIAQTDIDKIAVNNLTKKAINAYKKGEYQAALTIFEDVHNLDKRYPDKEIVHFMLGKTYYKLQKYELAAETQSEFFLRYANHRLSDFVRYNLGEIYYRQGKYPLSIKQFLDVAVNSESASLRSKGMTMAGHVLDSKVTLEDIRRLRDRSLDNTERAFLTVKISQGLYAKNAGDLARKEARSFLEKHKNTPYKKELARLGNGSYEPKISVVNIGVLLPLSGDFSENGLNILRGIQTAFNAKSDEIKKQINFTIIDNESDQVKTVQAMMKFADDPSILAVIGPMLSENTTAAAAIANAEGIPLISPTATKDGIAGLGEYSFQMNIDLEGRGRNLAQFARDSLNIERVAILSPADAYGKQMTDSFAKEFDHLGGRIVSQSWYYGEPQNLRAQFAQLRRTGFQLMEELFPTEAPPDTFEILEDTTLTDSVKLVMLKKLAMPKEEIDSSKITLDVIDGFYLPIQFGEIEFIAPQFAFWNLRTQILGGQNWYDDEALRDKDISKYLEGLVFSSDIYREEDNFALNELDTLYQKTYGVPPARTDIFGYDCFNLVADVIEGGAVSREIMSEHLSEVGDFKGVAGIVDFTGVKKRVNSAVHILRLRDKTVTKIN